jgi:hypothetical protein
MNLLEPYADELQGDPSTTEANYAERSRDLRQRVDAASWQAFRDFFASGYEGQTGAIRNGAETLLEFTANADGSVTVREIAG